MSDSRCSIASRALDQVIRLCDGPTPQDQWKRHTALLIMMWSLCTVLLMQFRPGYTFPPFELLDSWIYTSYMWDWKNQIADFGPTYYGSRLSWFLPGIVFQSILPAATANICFKLTVSALLALGCGVIIYRGKGLAAALLAVGLSVLCPQIIVALHSDYVDTGVIMYGVLTLACITLAKDSRKWPGWIFLAGLCFTGMAICNLSTLTAPGVGIALFHLVWLRWSFKRQAICVGLYLAAAGLLIVAIDFISRRAGASTHFLKPQIDMLFYMNGLKDSNPWSPKNWDWITSAVWLVLPVCSLLCGLFRSLVAPATDATARHLTLALTCGLAASLGTAFIFELRGMGVLLLYYYVTFHLCLAVPLLVLSCTPDKRPRKETALWTAGALVALLAFILCANSLAHSKTLFGLFSFLKAPQPVPLILAGLLMTVAGFVALFVHFTGKQFMPKILRGEFLLLGIVVCSQYDGFNGPEISDHLRDRYRAVHAAYRIVAEHFPPRSFRYWIDGTQRDGISVASTKLWGYRLFTLELFPDFEKPDLSGNTIILLGAPGKGSENLTRLYEALARRDFEPVDPQIMPVPGKAGAGFDLISFTMQLRTYDPERSTNEKIFSEGFASYTSAEPDPYTSHLGFVAGGTRAGDLITSESGYPIFHRTQQDDHAATHFAPLPPGKPDDVREFALVLEMPADGACTVMVQDEHFNNLKTILLTSAGHSCHNFFIPAAVKELRIVLASYDQPNTPLPTRMTLYRFKRESVAVSP